MNSEWLGCGVALWKRWAKDADTLKKIYYQVLEENSRLRQQINANPYRIETPSDPHAHPKLKCVLCGAAVLEGKSVCESCNKRSQAIVDDLATDGAMGVRKVPP
jgi:hypothetical protein